MSAFLRRTLAAFTVALAPLWAACTSDGGGDGDGTGPTPTITINLAPGSLTLARGEDGTITVTLVRGGGFTGSVNLSVEGLPTGVTASAGSIGASATQGSIDLSAGAEATLGSATLTIRATGAGVDAAIATLALLVQAAPAGTFQLSLDPATLSLEQGEGGTATVRIDRSGGFTSTVDLAVSGVPTGVVAALGSVSVAGNETSLQVDVGGAAGTGTFSLTITGTGEGTSNATAQLQLTVTESTGGGSTQATWSFCADVPLWLAVLDGAGGTWERILPTAGGGGVTSFEVTVDSDRVGVAWAIEDAFGSPGNTDLTVQYMAADELPIVGASFCEDAGSKSVNVNVLNLGLTESASLALGGSLTTIGGAVPPTTGVFERVPDGTLDLFGARTEIDFGTLTQEVNRYYLERGLAPADGSTVTVDFQGPNSFDPVDGMVTIGNLGASVAGVGLGYVTASASSFLTVASFGDFSPNLTREVPLVPASRQAPGDVHALFVSALNDLNDPEFLRSGVAFFEGVDDQQVTLGPLITGLDVGIGSAAPYPRPRIQYGIPAEYDRSWTASFDQNGRTVGFFVTDGWVSGSNLDVTFPDLTPADGFDPNWALQAGEPTTVFFIATGWNVQGGTLVPQQLLDGTLFLSGSWNGEIVP